MQSMLSQDWSSVEGPASVAQECCISAVQAQYVTVTGKYEISESLYSVVDAQQLSGMGCYVGNNFPLLKEIMENLLFWTRTWSVWLLLKIIIETSFILQQLCWLLLDVFLWLFRYFCFFVSSLLKRCLPCWAPLQCSWALLQALQGSAVCAQGWGERQTWTCLCVLLPRAQGSALLAVGRTQIALKHAEI